IFETNSHNKSFYLTACHTSLSDSTVASAKQQQEESSYARGRLVTQDGISVHVNPIGGFGGHVAPLASGMVVSRGGLERLVRVEPRPSPPVAPQRVAGVRSLAVSHHDEPALELVGVAYCAGGHLVRRGREDLFHQNGAVRKVPRLPVGVDRPRGGVDGVDFLRALPAVGGNRPAPDRLVEGSEAGRLPPTAGKARRKSTP